VPVAEEDPAVAAALFAAWSGDPAVVVASPPGAGKTRLVIHLSDQLQRRAGLHVAIATQTRAQALDVTNRAARIGAAVGLLGVRDSRRPLSLDPRANYLGGPPTSAVGEGLRLPPPHAGCGSTSATTRPTCASSTFLLALMVYSM